MGLETHATRGGGRARSLLSRAALRRSGAPGAEERQIDALTRIATGRGGGRSVVTEGAESRAYRGQRNAPVARGRPGR